MRVSLQPTQRHAPGHSVFKNIIGRLQGFLNKFNNDWTMQFAGTLAYNLMVAVVPIVIAIIAVFGLTVGSLNPAAQAQLIQHIESAFPSNGSSSGSLLQVVFTTLHKNAGLLGIIAIFTAIFGGSRLFIAIEGCFDVIYRTYPRKIIAQNIMAILMMIIFIILIPLMVFTSSVPAILLSLVQHSALSQLPIIAQLTRNSFFLGLIGIFSSLVVSWILFEAIFLVVPNQRISFKHSWGGALISAVLLVIFLAAFPFYISHFMGNYSGEAGFAVILLLFFYYFAVILLLGAQVNAYFAEHIEPLPNNVAAVLHDATSHAANPAEEEKTGANDKTPAKTTRENAQEDTTSEQNNLASDREQAK